MNTQGLFKSPYDSRDYLLKSFFYIKDAVIPDEFDLTNDMTDVRSQGNEGACAGFATATGVKEFQETTGEDAKPGIILSPRYVYEEAKLISGHKEGTTLKACMQVIHERGVCEEKYWPYVPTVVGERDVSADKNASKYKVLSYARITNLNELKQAIVEFGATLIGVEVYKTMTNDKAEDTGIVSDPSCWDRFNVLGGHALTACAYNNNSPYFKNDGHVKCKNSWGKNFGDEGYFYLSYKYTRSNMLDAFSCVDIDVPHIETVASLPRTRERLWV